MINFNFNFKFPWIKLMGVIIVFIKYKYSELLLTIYRKFRFHEAILTYTEDEFDIPAGLSGIMNIVDRIDVPINGRKIKWRWNIKPRKFSRKSEGWKKEKWSIENLTPYCPRTNLYPKGNDCDTEITFGSERPAHTLNNDGSEISFICTDCGEAIFSYNKNWNHLSASEYKKKFAIEAKKQIERNLRRS